jgi:hypothetical protein
MAARKTYEQKRAELFESERRKALEKLAKLETDFRARVDAFLEALPPEIREAVK